MALAVRDVCEVGSTCHDAKLPPHQILSMRLVCENPEVRQQKPKCH
jgi:hypothetical protein